MVGRHNLAVYIVTDRGEQAALVTQGTEHVIEHSDNCGLAVGAGHAYQTDLVGRIVKETRSHRSHRIFAIEDLNIGHRGFDLLGNGFTQHGNRSKLNGFIYIHVSVNYHAAHSHKESARRHFS